MFPSPPSWGISLASVLSESLRQCHCKFFKTPYNLAGGGGGAFGGKVALHLFLSSFCSDDRSISNDTLC